MIEGLTLHLLVFFALGYGVQKSYDAWVRCRVSSRFVIWVGLSLVILQLAWLALPLVNPLRSLEWSLPGIYKRVVFWWGWILVVALVLIAVVGIARNWWAKRHIQLFTTENPMSLWGMESTVYYKTEIIQTQLEEHCRNFSGSPNLRIRFSEYLEVPVVTGFLSPTIILPVRFLMEPFDRYLETVLDHQAEHVRLRHTWIYGPIVVAARLLPPLSSLLKSIGRAMFFRVDQLVLSRGGELAWQDYSVAFHESMDSAMGCSPLIGLSQPPRELDERLAHVKEPSGGKGYGFLVLMALLLLTGIACSFLVGHVSPYAIREFLVRHQVSGYQTRVFDPNVHIQAIPDAGGVIGDGVAIDTTQASKGSEITSVQVDLENRVPSGAEAVAISFDYTAEPGGQVEPASFPTISTRSMQFEWDESQNLHRFHVFDFRFAYLMSRAPATQSLRLIVKSASVIANPPTSHRYAYSPHDAKDYGDMLAGPDVAVPRGWKVRIWNWRVEKIPKGTVNETKFPEDVQDFVEWYSSQTNRTPINTKW